MQQRDGPIEVCGDGWRAARLEVNRTELLAGERVLAVLSGDEPGRKERECNDDCQKTRHGCCLRRDRHKHTPARPRTPIRARRKLALALTVTSLASGSRYLSSTAMWALAAAASFAAAERSSRATIGRSCGRRRREDAASMQRAGRAIGARAPTTGSRRTLRRRADAARRRIAAARNARPASGRARRARDPPPARRGSGGTPTSTNGTSTQPRRLAAEQQHRPRHDPARRAKAFMRILREAAARPRATSDTCGSAPTSVKSARSVLKARAAQRSRQRHAVVNLVGDGAMAARCEIGGIALDDQSCPQATPKPGCTLVRIASSGRNPSSTK